MSKRFDNTTTAPVKIGGAIEPEFFRLPTRGTDPYFGLTRPWYYNAINDGLIKSVSLRRPGTTKGVRLINFQSVRDYLRSLLK
jgi:hypothetical protein